MFVMLLAGAALAGPHVGLSVGAETTVNDPFVIRRGPRLGVAVAFSPMVEVGAAVSYYPVLGQGGCADPDWTTLACTLLEKNSVSPDISKMTLTADVELRVLPFRAQLGAWETAVGLAAGTGFVTTEDDLVALQAEDEPPDGDAHRTANQLHPTLVGGLLGEVRTRHFGVRVRLRELAYIETVRSSTLEMKRNLFTGTEVFFWF